MESLIEALTFALCGVAIVETLVYLSRLIRVKLRSSSGQKHEAVNERGEERLLRAAQRLLEATCWPSMEEEHQEEQKQAWLRLAKEVKTARARYSLEGGSDAEVLFALRELRELGDPKDLPAIGAVIEREDIGDNVRDLASKVGHIIESKSRTRMLSKRNDLTEEELAAHRMAE